MFGPNNFAHATPEKWNELMLALQIMQVTCKYLECCYVCSHISVSGNTRPQETVSCGNHESCP